MKKYPADFKLMVIRELRDSIGAKADVYNKYGIPKETVSKWEKMYNLYGEAGLTGKYQRATYSGTFKQKVVEDMRNNHLSQHEVSLKYHVGRTQIQNWERIYLQEGPEGLYIERRGRNSTGKPPKALNKKVEEDLIAENQRLRMEVAYLKKLNALVREKERLK